MNNACNQDSETWETKLLKRDIETIMLKHKVKYNSQFYNYSDFLHIITVVYLSSISRNLSEQIAQNGSYPKKP